MKRGTLSLPKLRLLARELNIPISHAAGILVCLWGFAAETPKYRTGSLAGLSDDEIAEACHWTGEPSALIAALASEKCRWLDRVNGQLRIHDWHEHCEDYVDKYLADKGLCYANGKKPRRVKSDNVGQSLTKSDAVEKSQELSALPVASCQLPLPETTKERESAAEPPAAPSTTTKTEKPSHWIMDLWNSKASQNLPRCRFWSKSLAKHAKARLSEIPDRQTWDEIIIKINASEFCNGKNDRGWRADIHWLMERADAAHKVLEGKYDNKTTDPIKPTLTPEEQERYERQRRAWEARQAREQAQLEQEKLQWQSQTTTATM